MNKALNVIAKIVTFVIILLVLSLPLWVAWNLVMPYTFNLPTIDLFQAFWLQMVAILLFGNRIIHWTIGVIHDAWKEQQKNEMLKEALQNMKKKYSETPVEGEEDII